MPVQPTKCFVCKHRWTGIGPICDSCYNMLGTPPPIGLCNFCGSSNHNVSTCLAAKLFNAQQQQKAAAQAKTYSYTSQYGAAIQAMRNKTKSPVRRSKPYVDYQKMPSHTPKACSRCKGLTCIETKAGSLCMSCKYVTHNPCRNCNSTATHGVSGDSMQFIECNDCCFIE